MLFLAQLCTRQCGSALLGFALGLLFIRLFDIQTPNFYSFGVQSTEKPESEQLSTAKTPTSNDANNSGPNNLHQRIQRFQQAEGVAAKRLYDSVRVLCWISTAPNNEEKLRLRQTILETWGTRCHVLLFVVGGDNGTGSHENVGSRTFILRLPMQDDASKLWLKTKLAFPYIHTHFRNQYDWVIKADDDTYVIMENLRLFLGSQRPENPFYYGFPIGKPPGYNMGGPGYVLSASNMDKLVRRLRNDECVKNDSTDTEGSMMAKCLRLDGIEKTDTRDEDGRIRFSPFQPIHTVNTQQVPKKFDWLLGLAEFPFKMGVDCCADDFISFHYVTPEIMRTMEYLIYYLHPFSSRDTWKQHVENDSYRIISERVA